MRRVKVWPQPTGVSRPVWAGTLVDEAGRDVWWADATSRPRRWPVRLDTDKSRLERRLGAELDDRRPRDVV